MSEPRPEDLWRIEAGTEDLLAAQEYHRTELERAARERSALAAQAKQRSAMVAATTWRLTPFCLRYLRGALALLVLIVGGSAMVGQAPDSGAIVGIIGLTVVVGFPVAFVIDRLAHGRLRRWHHLVLCGVLGAAATGALAVSQPGATAFLIVATIVLGAVLGTLVRLAAGFRGVKLRPARSQPSATTP